MAKRIKYIIGIDEVGRGPLAGPLVVAALAAPRELKIKNAEFRIKQKSRNSKFFFCQRQIPGGSILNFKLAKLRDSKKLSPKQRELWFEYVKQSQKSKVKSQRLYYAVASVSPKVIDRINVSNAANLAATSAFKALIQNYKLRIKNCRVYLDGGLFLNSKFCTLNSTTVVKGDEKIPAIALASIAAKVIRDRMMRKLHKKYPEYGFDRHKGYGTKYHFKMIKKHGLSLIHRRSFKTS